MQDSNVQLKFVSTISEMGGRLIINVPASYRDKAEKLKGKQIRVVIDDEF